MTSKTKAIVGTVLFLGGLLLFLFTGSSSTVPQVKQLRAYLEAGNSGNWQPGATSYRFYLAGNGGVKIEVRTTRFVAEPRGPNASSELVFEDEEYEWSTEGTLVFCRCSDLGINCSARAAERLEQLATHFR